MELVLNSNIEDFLFFSNYLKNAESLIHTYSQSYDIFSCFCQFFTLYRYICILVCSVYNCIFENIHVREQSAQLIFKLN